MNRLTTVPHRVFTCSDPSIETLEHGVKSVQSINKGSKTTSLTSRHYTLVSSRRSDLFTVNFQLISLILVFLFIFDLSW